MKGTARFMADRRPHHALPPSCSKKLIIVIEQDEQIGTQFVRLIRQETSFQAILARSLAEVRNILQHLKSDVFLLTDATFLEEDLKRLSLFPPEVEPPALLSVAFLSCMYDYRDERDVRNIVKAVKLLLSVRDGTRESPSPL